MKFLKILSTTFFVLLFCIGIHESQAQRSQDQVGIGLMAGEPTGLSLKVWTSDTNAFDAGLAWSLGRYDAVNIHADYLWHRFDVFEPIESGQLPIYYGIGGRIVFAEDYPDPGDSNVVLGARLPVGINYLFADSPIGLFFEVAPIINLIPETDFDVDGAIGIRFYL